VFGAVLLPLALPAVRAGPDGIELGGNGINELFVGGNKSGFKIAASGTLGAHAGTGEIGAAAISKRIINYHGFEMDAGADDPLQALKQSGVAVEIALENRAGLLGVQEAKFDASISQVREDFEKGHHLAALGNVEVLQIGSG